MPMSRRAVLRCVKCPSRIAKGEKPYCVNSCPCDVLSIGEDAEAKAAELQ